ncbi:phosphatase PAP2 family protein [Candidatus Saccharibacteria bacterium]|nr:phosphatase PAP2 family protein [Candidatus Saccharibacteria bacterium]
MNWDKATDIMVYTAIIAAGILAVLAIYQWITTKSFWKIDKTLIALIVPAVLVVITYFLFDHVFIWNTRPDGSGESSFPSTHTMITATIFFCVAIALPRYIKNKYLLAFLDLVMLAFIILVPVGRVLANKHWVSDCIGAIIFSVIFAGIYYLTVKNLENSKNSRKTPEKSKNSKKEQDE